MIRNNFLAIMMHLRFMGHQSYVCTETTVSNHPVVFFLVKYQRLSKIEIF